jgi:hypothetical protein
MPLSATNGSRLPALKTHADLSPQRVQISLRSRFNPIRNLTPEGLAGQIDAFKSGQLREGAILFETIEERDDVLKAVAPKRKKAVARHGFEILMVDDSQEAKRHKEALEYFYNHLTCVNGYDLNERGSFKLLVRQMMDAVAKRYAIHEIVWKPSTLNAQPFLTAEFRFVPLWFFENRTGRLRFLKNEFDQEGRDLEDGGWMVTVGEGLMIACSIAYMFKRLPLQDWLGYSEKFGFPGLLGKTTAAKGSDQWDNMIEAVEKFSVDWAAVVNQGEMIEMIEAKGQGNLPFPPLVDRMDRAMATLWRGADLGTISKGEGLGASLQGDEGDILEEDDAELISETLNLYVDPHVIRYQFGPDAKPLAYLRIITPQKENIDMDLKVDDFLLKAGAPVAISDTLERYNRALPDAGEPLLTPPVNPAPILGGGFPNEAQSKLEEASREHLSRALAEDLQPIRDRLARILQIEDPDVLAARLRAFLDELPRLLKSINADPAAAKALEETMSAALLNGLAAGKPGQLNHR